MLASRPTIVNTRNVKGETALNIAISRSDDLWTALPARARAPNPNLPAANGDTPLIAAARVGFTGAVELLLALGAKIDAANRMGETPLIVAVQQRELDVVKMLLARGANPDKTDTAAGYSARDYAKRDTRTRDILAAIEAAGNRSRDQEGRSRQLQAVGVSDRRPGWDRSAPTDAARRAWRIAAVRPCAAPVRAAGAPHRASSPHRSGRRRSARLRSAGTAPRRRSPRDRAGPPRRNGRNSRDSRSICRRRAGLPWRP